MVRGGCDGERITPNTNIPGKYQMPNHQVVRYSQAYSLSIHLS